MKGLVLAM